MNDFQKIPYYDRSLFIAKLYNHAWYDKDRFAILEKLLNEWEANPPREVKFLNDLQESLNIDDIIN
jgi:hypothetical protein